MALEMALKRFGERLMACVKDSESIANLAERATAMNSFYRAGLEKKKARRLNKTKRLIAMNQRWEYRPCAGWKNAKTR